MKLNNKRKWLKAECSSDIVVAIGTVLLTWISFYVMYHTESMMIKGVVFAVFTNIGLNVVFPCCWCLIHKKEKLSELGITKKNLFFGLIIGLALAYVKVYQLFPMLDGIDWAAHLLYNFFLFWEPFFIFGWLQSRFEKSFGIIGGIILAGVSLGVYHIGSFTLFNVLILTLNGIVFATVYRLTKNLISMWPVFWCVSAAVGTLSGNMIFGIEIAFVYMLVFFIQIGFIIFFYKCSRKGINGR